MSGQDTLRLDKLTLKNFRCFAECEIELHPELTVLVADNGQGKTALLDAIAVALGLFVHTLDAEHNPLKDVSFAASDARLTRASPGNMEPKLPVVVGADGHVDGKRVSWERSLNHVHHIKVTDGKAKKLSNAAESMRQRLASYVASSGGVAPVLPAIACYGTSRLWSESRLTEERRRVGADRSKAGRTAGYLDCLSPNSSFKTFVVWYEEIMKTMKGSETMVPGFSIVSGRQQEDRPESLLAAIEEAVRSVLRPTRWQHLGWNIQERKLLVTHEDGHVLPVGFLSDGVRTMIGLVADLAHRCVRLNPQFGAEAARMTPGVVLIDEVDMHLHPGWQQTVVGLLRETFPRIQFVLTTHSPQVLSTVDSESVRVLSVTDARGVTRVPTYQTRGVQSSDVLALTMGVHATPQVEQAIALSAYRAALENGTHETSENQILWGKLVDHFGDGHPVFQEIDTLRRLYEFKRRRVIIPTSKV